MKEFFEAFEEFFWKMWNELYKYLSEIFGTEVNPDYFAPLDK